MNFILDELAPIRTFQTRVNYAPWLSDETKLFKKQREEAQEKAARTNDLEDWRLFRAIRNQVTRRSRSDKKQWEENKLDEADNVWGTVKNWLGWKKSGSPTKLFYNGGIVTRPASIATSMNKFFIDKVKSLRKNIPQVARDPLREMREAMQHRECKFKLNPVSTNEVSKLISGLKTSSATGMDYIDTNTVKIAADQLAQILAFIINLT